MKTLWNSSNYGNDLRLTKRDANQCTHPGPCDNDVKQIMQNPYVIKQLKTLDPAQLAKELKEFGAWDEKQLSDHNENLIRWIWISAGDIIENLYQ